MVSQLAGKLKFIANPAEAGAKAHRFLLFNGPTKEACPDTKQEFSAAREATFVESHISLKSGRGMGHPYSFVAPGALILPRESG
jgi:hypothetical protein